MSEDSDYQHDDESLLETVCLPKTETVHIRDVLGKDMKFLGYVFNYSGDLVVVETSSSAIYSSGSPVLFENCEAFGFIVDIFGPITKPLYIVSPLEKKAHVDGIGVPVYVCEALCKCEILEEGEVSEGSCSSLSDSEGGEFTDEN